jgi:hypothetical protein
MAKKSKPGSISGLEASPVARKHACVLLEVLSGLKGPGEAAEELAISLPRYYVLEARALEGFVKALEPRERGPGPASAETRLAQAKRESEELRKELTRAQSMLRMARKAAGLSSEKRSLAGKGKKHKRRKGNRTRRVMAMIGGENKGEKKTESVQAEKGA